MIDVFFVLVCTGQLGRSLWLHLASTAALRAENVFLRRQLALYIERGSKPRRPGKPDRIWLVLASRFFAWREALVIVKPATLIRWQRAGVRLLWRWKSRPIGRPPLPAELRALIMKMAAQNPTWGQERIKNEVLLKLGVRVSPGTIRKVLGRSPRGGSRRDQRWSTFIRNHANAIVACDFVVSTTVTLRSVYTLVVIELGSRRILHMAATSHPTAAWTTQELRDALPADHAYRSSAP